jgi:hypothetical protein
MKLSGLKIIVKRRFDPFSLYDERPVILGVLENLLPPPAAVHDMIPGAGKFESEWS